MVFRPEYNLLLCCNCGKGFGLQSIIDFTSENKYSGGRKEEGEKSCKLNCKQKWQRCRNNTKEKAVYKERWGKNEREREMEKEWKKTRD